MTVGAELLAISTRRCEFRLARTGARWREADGKPARKEDVSLCPIL